MQDTKTLLARRTLLKAAGGLALAGALPRTLLAAEAQAAEAVAGGEPAGRLPVTVGVFGSASVVAIAPAKRLLEASDVELRAREVDVEAMQDAVSAGRIDVGIGIDYQQVIKGLVLLAAVCLDVYNKNKAG